MLMSRDLPERASMNLAQLTKEVNAAVARFNGLKANPQSQDWEVAAAWADLVDARAWWADEAFAQSSANV